MQKLVTSLVLISIILGAPGLGQSYTVQLTDAAGTQQIRWLNHRIKVALSASLSNPGPEVKAGSDVLGAVRRAMSRWSSIANVQFVETSSKAMSISPAAGGDGVSLITIGDTPENNAIFSGGNNPGRTRVFYDPATGAIAEADVVINPHPMSADGSPILYSTDETPGTYDLESAFTHELGHLLGLEHSAVIGATMQARQAMNGLFNSPAATNRTLSEDDRAAARGIYGPHEGLGAIEGKIITSNKGGQSRTVFGAHVWAENAQSGRVIASTISLADGNYRIESLPAGTYRIVASYLDGAVMAEDIASGGAYAGIASQSGFHTAELATQLNVSSGLTRTLNAAVVPTRTSPQFLKPRLLGLNSQLSTVAVPLTAGRTYTLFVAGEGVDQVPAGGISVTSPYMTVNPASLTRQQFGSTFPVISFEVTVAPNAPFGDYSVRMQEASGEIAFLAGGLSVDPGIETATPNPADDPRFFVRQQYRDFLGREADQNGLTYWTDQLTQCGNDMNCIHARRIDVSTAFLSETEFQETGSYVYRLYKAALGRRLSFVEFLQSRSGITPGATLETSKQIVAKQVVQQPEFAKLFPGAMTASEFVDGLLSQVLRTSGVDLFSRQEDLLGKYDGTDQGRAAIVRTIADNELLARTEYNKSFVLMQYFGFLRRDPDQQGYDFWLNALNDRQDPDTYRGIVCAFVSSNEYQLRFGMVLTHSNGECQ